MPTRTVNKYSEHGLNSEVAIDVASLSDTAATRLRDYHVVISTAAGQLNAAHYVINTTKDHYLGLAGVAGIVTGGYITYRTKPAGGTLSQTIGFLDVSNSNTFVGITDASDPELMTSATPSAQVLAAANVAMAADDIIVLRCIADNNTVTQDAVETLVSLAFRPSAPAVTTTSYR